MTTLDLHGKTAIVTGASRGIGLAAAQALATAGANVRSGSTVSIAGQSGRSLGATVLALVELFERSHQ
jgi:NAD(P)-dependent dehydrogenase (short-subunit alcohol dehydrogenase family)